MLERLQNGQVRVKASCPRCDKEVVRVLRPSFFNIADAGDNKEFATECHGCGQAIRFSVKVANR